jgi:Lon protease-like protein
LEGKQRSRCNAVRHDLTVETVIASLEDTEDYHAFEATVIADYDAQTAVECELVLRIASLLWRLRRTTGRRSNLRKDCKVTGILPHASRLQTIKTGWIRASVRVFTGCQSVVPTLARLSAFD